MSLCEQVSEELLRQEDFMDNEARDSMLETLRDAHNRPIDFTIHDFHVTGAALGEVVTAMEQRRIRVHYLSSAGTRLAYCTDADAFVVGFRSAAGPIRKAAIVHEAVHAFADLRAARWMHVQTSEAAAYIAQYLYYLMITGAGEGPISDSDPAINAVFTAAGRVANLLYRGQTPTREQYETVRAAIHGVESYRAREGQPIPYNGVRQA
jgi:hypothetical protein